MKKLFSLILVALISSQMWGAMVYAHYATGSSNTMGKIGINMSSSWPSTSAPSSGYVYVSGTSTNVRLAAEALSGYTFVGWYSDASATTLISTNAQYLWTYGSNTGSSKGAYAKFVASGGGGGGNSDPVAPTAGAKVSYTATPGTNAMQQGPNVTIPNIANAVDLGFNVLWAKKNVGAASVDYRGTSYTYDAAKALSASTLGGTGWRLPTYDEISSSGLGALNTQKVGNNVVFTRSTGYNGVTFEIALESAGATDIWTSYESGSYRRYARANKTGTLWVMMNQTTSTSYTAWVRPVFDLAAAGIKKLTINVVKDGVTTTNNYYVANNQQVAITPATVSGYNSSWTSGASGTGTKTFTVTSNTTATITYTEAISYVTATFNNWDGTQLAQYTNVVSGTTPTYGGSTPTKPSTQTVSEVTTYSFTGWSPALGAITTNTTYTAQFSSSTTPRTYTIRFLMDDGTTVLSSAQVVYNGSPIEPSEPTKIGTEEYSYNFTGWTPAVTAVTGDQDYVAVFQQVAKAPKYNLTIGAFTNGSVTLTANGKTDVVPAAGGTYQYEEGTTIIVKAVPAKGYHFNQWNDANTAASRQVSEIAANMTLTPTFAVNAQFLMDDTWEQAAFISNCAAATGVLTVTLKDRTYSAGQWATLSVPFNCTLDQEDELYNAVYKLHTLTLAQDGGSVSFEFIRTNVVEANEPYLIVPRHDISTVVFHGVTLTTPAEVSRTTDDRVTFVSGLWKQTISGPNEFYVATGNSLRYASSLGTNVKGNRAFFRKINDAASSPAPRRAIMVIDGEEVEVEIAGDAIEEVQVVRKYIENGVLIIERNGVRMDAQGKRID